MNDAGVGEDPVLDGSNQRDFRCGISDMIHSEKTGRGIECNLIAFFVDQIHTVEGSIPKGRDVPVKGSGISDAGAYRYPTLIIHVAVI